MKKRFLPTLSIIVASVFWGTTGLFNKCFSDLGFSASDVVVFRMLSAAVFMTLFILIKDRKAFIIKLSNLPILLLIGAISIFSTSYFYINSISASSMSVAAILMYTAPFIVVIASCFIYKEKLTARKICALIIAFIGCILVSGLGKTSTFGIVFGLLSGITYASYSIFSKTALKSMSSYTITLYGFIIAAASALITTNPVRIAKDVVACGYKIILPLIFIGIITSILPYLFYTYGLKHTEAGKASIISMLEPLVATLLGFIVLGQKTGIPGIIGIIFIVSAVIIIEMKVKKDEQ